MRSEHDVIMEQKNHGIIYSIRNPGKERSKVHDPFWKVLL